MQSLTILGSTGSIGKNLLSIIDLHRDDYRVFALTANHDVATLADQCEKFKPRYAVITQEDKLLALQQLFKVRKLDTEILSGFDALVDVAKDSTVDLVAAAIVGAAGLAPTYAAICAGKKVLLANKESLVTSGHLMRRAARRHGAQVFPVDSEHNAMFQAMPDKLQQSVVACDENLNMMDYGIEKLLLTASGGPFREFTKQQLETVSVEQACAHPNWRMGRKISVDSATLMNKGLELIEACWLFNTSPALIDVAVHPESVVHSFVAYKDGSMLAQLGTPDMRTPLASCLAWPQRIESMVSRLDLFELAKLSFFRPEIEKFPCLSLASQAFHSGQTTVIAMNAANEVAVDAFLNGKIRFVDIPSCIDSVLTRADSGEPESIDEVIASNQRYRALTAERIKRQIGQ